MRACVFLSARLRRFVGTDCSYVCTMGRKSDWLRLRLRLQGFLGLLLLPLLAEAQFSGSGSAAFDSGSSYWSGDGSSGDFQIGKLFGTLYVC